MTARRNSFSHAIIRFNEVLKASETDISRDAAIQRFEFCFELAWKVIQEQARVEGLDCQSPKGCLK
ncbi:MAG: nucleotidyltransferase substrate binding protein, partial [Nitrospiraceae bacterium]